MPERTAHTRIDVGSATLANAWLTRSWSAFLGDTVSLRHRAADEEWVARSGPDLALRAEERDWHGVGLGGPSWSEEANPHGATLQAEFDRDGIVVRWRCFAFHACPAMTRVVSVHNFTDRAWDTGPVVLEQVALVGGLRASVLEWDAVHIAGGGAAWMISADPPADAPSRKPDGGYAVRIEAARNLAPGAAWSLPEIAWVACADATAAAAQAAWGEFLLARRNLRAWLEANRAAQAGDARNN